MCISVERWYAICYPLRFNSTPSRARLTIVIIWVVSTSIVVPELVFLDIHPPSGFSPDLTILLTSCRPTWHYQAAYQLFLIVAMYVLPFALMFVAYVQIARCLWSNPLFKAPGEGGSTPRSRSDERADVQLQERRKVAKMLIAVVVMFGIFYLPVHVLNISRWVSARSWRPTSIRGIDVPRFFKSNQMKFILTHCNAYKTNQDK
ncbi:hypothetical protein NP493_1081g02026 [Ridgeia piscesae]|uniref:G-protein coupled receptors family 1 profile domain-containing protein n=1 Tax=Ridgeia piscesae TaxID=27915 RepID=A0AAD9KHG3_RIDPI|nr:hypothetical protein NP493_1081g02026 [Ridgeia piscesae]